MNIFFKRVGAIILFCILGWGLGYLYGVVNLNGYLIQWKSLGNPPIMPNDILAIDNGVWINTNSGEIYYYNDTVNCKENCWEKTNSKPSVTKGTLSLEKCSIPKSRKNFTSYQGKCESYGPGGFYVVYYGISTDGTIYQWEDFSAEGDEIISIIAPIIGLFSGLILSIGIVIILYVKDFTVNLRQRQQNSNT